MKKTKQKIEFSKKLLIVDYSIMVILLICTLIWGDTIDLPTVVAAWSAQLGISSVAYYWKARCENRVKVPMSVIKSLPPKIRDDVDMTQIITAIIQAE